MLDPSLVLRAKGLEWVERSSADFDILIPAAFARLVGRVVEGEDSESIRRALAFYGGPKFLQLRAGDDGEELPVALTQLLNALRRLEHFEHPQGPIAYRNPELAPILNEEFAFLTKHSWLSSRIFAPFRVFIDRGAAALQLGRSSWDSIVRRTLKITEEDVPSPLTKREHLRSLAKWVAVGGSGVSSLFDPIMGALAGTASGYFLLLDP